MTTSSFTLPRFVSERLTQNSAVRNVALVVAASFLIAISAQIAIPLQPVPMTLQPVAILLVGAALGSKRGASAAALYLLEGLSGMPVFAGGAGGPLVFLGPTAGYLLAFPAAAWIAGMASERGWARSMTTTIPPMALAIATIHLGGWSWLATAMGLGAEKAFFIGVAPFWASDILKIAIAATLLPAAQGLLSRDAR
ncbi:MAG: biotin transporter BioY [Thermoanaerobaculia bacterium]|jgi:biotin transport system substrate-specific component